MKILQITLLLFFSVQISFSQNFEIINNEAILFNIKCRKDTVSFIVADTKLNEKKPIFLFCQGSLPIPLFIIPENEKMWMFGGGIINFDIDEIKKYYHLIVISMPKTPVIADEKNLNKSYCYIPNVSKPHEFSKQFLTADNLENYESRANEVLNFLRKQKWVNNKKLVVAGHSQGSKVATMIALNNKNVTNLGLFSPNPFGRIDQFIRKSRKEAENNKITWGKANSEIEENYQMFRDAHNDSVLNRNPYLIAWKSFSRFLINDWLRIKIHTYLAYGTNDITSDLCDLVPLFYIQNSKSNLTFKRYLNLEHNFFETKEDGNANYEKEHWKEVMNKFVKWTLDKNKN